MMKKKRAYRIVDKYRADNLLSVRAWESDRLAYITDPSFLVDDVGETQQPQWYEI